VAGRLLRARRRFHPEHSDHRRASRAGGCSSPRSNSSICGPSPVWRRLWRPSRTRGRWVEEPAEDVGEVPLTPRPARLLGTPAGRSPRTSTSRCCSSLRQPLAMPALERAVAALVAHHAALRLRFVPDAAGGWRQMKQLGTVGRVEGVPKQREAATVQRIDLSALTGRRAAAGARGGGRAGAGEPGSGARAAAAAGGLRSGGRPGRTVAAWWRTTWWSTECPGGSCWRTT